MKNRKYVYVAMVGAVLVLVASLIPKRIYAYTDYNGDGFITKEEMDQYAQKYGFSSNSEMVQAFKSNPNLIYQKIEEYGGTVEGGYGGASSSTNASKKEETHEHSYTATVTKEPTCTEAGEMTYKCSCGDTYTEVIAMKSHDYESSVTKEPTCTEVGTQTKVCKNCGDTIETVIPALGHKPGDWVTEKEPTCSEEGRNVRYCTVCGEAVETMIVDKLPHTEGEWEIIQKPTLTKTGLKVVKCTECGEVLKEEVIPANTTLLYILIGLGCVALIGGAVGIIIYKRRR